MELYKIFDFVPEDAKDFGMYLNEGDEIEGDDYDEAGTLQEDEAIILK